MAAELHDRLDADADALRDELSAEVSAALDRLDEKGSRLLSSVRSSLEESSPDLLAEEDAEARGRFAALERAVGERVSLAEEMVRERVERTVSEARRAIAASIDNGLNEEARSLRETLDEPEADAERVVERSAEAAREEARRLAMRFRAEVKQHLKVALGSIEERLRQEVATGLQAARDEITVSLERDLPVAERIDSVRPALERSIIEVVEHRISERFGRLAAELWSRSMARLDHHAEVSTARATESATESVDARLEEARRRLRDELDAEISERLEVLATELREELGRESEATRSELAEDLAAALDRIRTELRADLGSSRAGMEGRLGPAGERASGELGARIESWIEDVRARSDAAEKRLEEERERRIVAAEARVEARGQEMLRTIRGDLDASRADADAAMGAALGNLDQALDLEADGLRRGLEGELARMLKLAAAELRADATNAILEAERPARQRIEASARRASDELETKRLRARTETEAALADALGTIRDVAREVLRVQAKSRAFEPRICPNCRHRSVNPA